MKKNNVAIVGNVTGNDASVLNNMLGAEGMSGLYTFTLYGADNAARKGETNLGDLWADALRWYAVSGKMAEAFDEDDIKAGNTLPLANIPVGTYVNSIELHPGKGGQLVRAAGTAAQLISKENGKAMIRLPSGEVRTIPMNCNATIGQIGNIEHDTVKIGKAGKKRHMGIRPTVRGSAMNPCDHPHGGGEGKSPVGHPGPLTPWGKPALGYKTRKHKARTEKFIVKHRSAK